MELPLAPIERILKKTNMKISKDAVKEFSILLEEITADIAAESVAIAKSKGRRTVILEDVVEAKRKIE